MVPKGIIAVSGDLFCVSGVIIKTYAKNMNLQQNQKLEYWDIIEYGINNIGEETRTDNIEEVFKGTTKVMDGLDNMEVWATNHAYLGQEHLCLSFEQGNFYGLIDFDLMPNNNLFGTEQTKRLANFKAQIFGKKAFLWHIPLSKLKLEICSNLKKQYGLPNNLDNLDEEKKEELIKIDQLLREQYKSITIVNPNDVQIWYIEKQGIYYCAIFYYFGGKKEVAPYLSFAISEVFRFNE